MEFFAHARIYTELTAPKQKNRPKLQKHKKKKKKNSFAGFQNILNSPKS